MNPTSRRLTRNVAQYPDFWLTATMNLFFIHRLDLLTSVANRTIEANKNVAKNDTEES